MSNGDKQRTIIGGKNFVYVFAIALISLLDFTNCITTGNKNDTDLNKGEFKRSSADYVGSRKPFDSRRGAENKIAFYTHNDEKQKDRTYFKGDHYATGSSNSVRGYGSYGSQEDQGYGYQGYDQHSYSGGPIGPGPSDDRDVGHYNYQPSYHSYQGGNDNRDHNYDNKDYVFDHRDHGYEHKGQVYHGYIGPPRHGHDNGLILKGILLPLAGVALLGAAAALVSNPVLLQLGVISGKRRRRKRSTQSQDIFKVDQYASSTEKDHGPEDLVSHAQNRLKFLGQNDPSETNIFKGIGKDPSRIKGDNGRKHDISGFKNNKGSSIQSKKIVRISENAGSIKKIETGEGKRKNDKRRTFEEIQRFGDGILSRTRRSPESADGNALDHV